ncbi:uncharacterized protein LOC110977848 [Acanthaster planci]|uniref:Uncharacterized protein LOC110977848 n=1 Tax=Acanthaster planci TaxID=133434 RepID=A0A8B7Y8E9_ACAPL|nr:uncharacterized protein LOC110977848 [Acanthaster planci]XP_022088026.1 uncharacterized protein LOC110977848 [Acanthaster planci]
MHSASPWVLAITILLGSQVGLSVGICKPDFPDRQLKPMFVQPKSDRLELLPGNSASLICEVDRLVDPENPPTAGLLIWWCNSTYPICHQQAQSLSTFDPKFLSGVQSAAINASHLRSEFNLTNVVPSQADLYYCVAYTQDESSSKCPGSVVVDIVIKDESKPKIISHSSGISVSEGSPFNLTCTAEGYPTPMFTWTKDGEPILGGVDGVFKKDKANVSDKGTYQCRAVNKFESSEWSPDIRVKVNGKEADGLSKVKQALLITAVVVFAILLVIVIVRILKLRSNGHMTCFHFERTTIRGNNSKVIKADTVHVHSDRRGSRLSRGDSSHERQTFLHDVFIHNHSSDNQFAHMIRAKLQNQESHLKVGLWSEVERPDRSSSRNKLLRLRLLNCTRIVIVVSEAYLKHDYHALTSALAKSRAAPESLRSKIIIVRVLEESKLPKDLAKDVMASMEYNVDTDSCYFWPRFLKVAMPDQKEILYWV